MSVSKLARATRRNAARAGTITILTMTISFALGGIGSTASPWNVEILSAVRTGSTVALTGSAFSPAGQASGNYLEIAWGDGDVETLPNFLGQGPWTWGPVGHTYDDDGSYTVAATLLHASRNGNDRHATDTVVVVIPGDEEDLEEDPEIEVQLVLGTCVSDGEGSSTPLNVVFTGDGQATVEVRDAADDVAATFTGSGSEQLAPGTYSYVVTAEEGSELGESSATSGELLVADCTPNVDGQASASIALGECDSIDGTSLTPLEALIAPEGAATVILSQGAEVIATFDGSGGSFDLVPGEYIWSAVANEGYELTGEAAGTITAEECPSVVLGGPPLVPGSGTGGDVELPKVLAKTGPGLPVALAMALVMAVAGAWLTVVRRRLEMG